MNMELRQDPTSGTWTLTGLEKKSDERITFCPFCPGKESENPQPIYEKFNKSGDWSIRVFPSIPPVFRSEGDKTRRAVGMYDLMGNYGAHEIIVETPYHNTTLSALSTDELVDVLFAYRQRIIDLKMDSTIRYILIFKNQGPLTGSTIQHLHSHIVGTPVIPERIERELRLGKNHYDLKERCQYCDIIFQESKKRERIVCENDEFISFTPFASRFPYETWIFPKIHSHSFEKGIEQKGTARLLALHLKDTLRRIERITKSYSLVLHNSPNENTFRTIGGGLGTLFEDFHWHIELLPGTVKTSRVKREEEFYTNSLFPEEAAKILRKME